MRWNPQAGSRTPPEGALGGFGRPGATEMPVLIKARSAADASRLEQLPNIGPSIAADLRRIGVTAPVELRSRDPFELYQTLCRISGKRQDPCVLDTFLAATDFMHGAPARPWWHYTADRKQRFGQV